MKIALIQPNSPFLINERVFPNIGLTRVATQLQADNHDVEILDFSGKNPEELKTFTNGYDLYGFSSTTPQFPYTMNLFNILKRNNPNAQTVIGGPHVSAMYSLKNKGIDDVNIKDLDNFDTKFVGEGEGKGIEKMFEPGWQDGGIVKNIDDALIPDRDFIDITGYKYNLNGQPTTSMQTQRGCPHQCTFCSGRDIEMYNKVRMHSPERVVEELDMLNDKYGFTSFMWYDDEINLNIDRLEDLCNVLADKPYQHRGFVRNDNIVNHPESVEWMKEAGFIKLCAGVESGSDKILKLINKRTTSEMNSDAREIVRKNGIHYESFLLMGHPDEDLDDISATMSWVQKNKPDDLDINLITPYPGSKMYDDAKPSTKFDGYNWEYKGSFFNKPRYATHDSFYKGKEGKGESDIRTNRITNRTLVEIRDRADKFLREYIKK